MPIKHPYSIWESLLVMLTQLWRRQTTRLVDSYCLARCCWCPHQTVCCGTKPQLSFIYSFQLYWADFWCAYTTCRGLQNTILISLSEGVLLSTLHQIYYYLKVQDTFNIGGNFFLNSQIFILYIFSTSFKLGFIALDFFHIFFQNAVFLYRYGPCSGTVDAPAQ